ncbi:hypothetical protein CAEBREN_05642 [Caenorhabditis brenneri]|uniref:Uncharacterized protein n=1 Tax=Caenorhabditis brenneri TaxID=135651 RepID=G0MWT7_CAEBE|nr:hypothetical protein CAEBREN_05642 [Caenorhabditis brenneri]
MNLILTILTGLLAVYAVTTLTPADPPQMIVFNGGILSRSGCVHNETIGNFTKCVVQCAKVESCQFCFMDNGCWMCKEGVLSADTDERRIGVKNVNKSFVNSCPAQAMHMAYQNPATSSTKTVINEVTMEAETTKTTTPKTAKPKDTTPAKICNPFDFRRNPRSCLIDLLNGH